MRIGLLTTSFPRFEGDVAGAFVLGFARALAARSHEIEVLAPEPSEMDHCPWGNDPLSVRWVPYVWPRGLGRTFYGAGVLDNVRRDPRAWIGLATFPVALARAAREAVGRWDAIVSHWALPSALVAGAIRGQRPHLAVMHSADLHLLSKLPRRGAIATRIAREASSMLFVSTAHRDAFLAMLAPVDQVEAGGRSHVSPMGVDLDALVGASGAARKKSLRRELGFDRFTLLSMGRLVAIKGIDRAIDAIAGDARVELVVAGDGPEREALVRRASERGARVRFLGTVGGEHKRALLAAADAFVVPSRPLPSGRSEGVPHAMLEAMAAGLPIIASDTGGIGSVVRDRREGLLVPPGDAAALGGAIHTLAAEKPLARKLARAAATSARRLAWTEIAPRVEELLVGATG